jgi:DNA-binding transcriptional MocR family regulator
MAIQRFSLRDQVRAELIGWLADGRLASRASGSRRNASASALGVSRTPLREALANLAREGLVDVRARASRLPRAEALSAERVRDLYPVIGSLEGLALRLSGPRVSEIATEPRVSQREPRPSSPHAQTARRRGPPLARDCSSSRNPNRELATLAGADAQPPEALRRKLGPRRRRKSRLHAACRAL